MLEDSQIIDRVKSGSPDSFTEIVERYQLPIIRYLYRLTGNYETVEDLRQDTFIRAYKGIFKTDIQVSFKAWLYRIATNVARQYLRRKRIVTFIPFKETHEKDISNSENDPSESIGERTAVRDTLARIPPKQRICMTLHFVEGFTYPEIAGIMKISEEAVRKRVARGSREFMKLE